MKKKASILFTLFLFVWSATCFAGNQTVSSTTAAEIIAQARYYINEESGAANQFWSDTELLQWVNDGTLDIVSMSRCLEGTEDIDLATGTMEYAITASYIAITAVFYTDANGTTQGLEWKDPRTIARSRETVPRWWYEWGGKIGIFPPLAARTTETITVYYVTRPTAVISTGNVQVPAQYDKALVLYVVGQAFLKDKMFGSYAQVMTAYQAEIDRYRSDFNRFTAE